MPGRLPIFGKWFDGVPTDVLFPDVKTWRDNPMFEGDLARGFAMYRKYTRLKVAHVEPWAMGQADMPDKPPTVLWKKGRIRPATLYGLGGKKEPGSNYRRMYKVCWGGEHHLPVEYVKDRVEFRQFFANEKPQWVDITDDECDTKHKQYLRVPTEDCLQNLQRKIRKF